jgi:hypothetical protein
MDPCLPHVSPALRIASTSNGSAGRTSSIVDRIRPAVDRMPAVAGHVHVAVARVRFTVALTHVTTDVTFFHVDRENCTVCLVNRVVAPASDTPGSANAAVDR